MMECVRALCKFTGKERDTESGLDNFGKRYFGSSLGRFQTPDPVLVSWRRMVNPQQWNAYSYVGNNPLRFVDPTGEELIRKPGDRRDVPRFFSDGQATEMRLPCLTTNGPEFGL
jgi:RHS repeat-associated protein